MSINLTGDLTGISSIVELGKTIIKRVWPDPVKQAEEVRKLTQLAQDGDLAKLHGHIQLISGQMEVNAKEAEHKSVFVAGWRPFIGWVCGTGLAYQFILYPILAWLLVFFGDGKIDPPPVMDAAVLMTLVTGMLGLATARSVDKKNGVTHR